jgi:hypothetical protein
MPSLSPVDAVSPAFSRTRSILYPPGPAPGLNAPFRLGFFLKIALVAALTQGNIYGAIFGIAFEITAVAFGIAAGIVGTKIHLTRSSLIVGHGLPAPILAAVFLFAFFAILLALLCTWIWCRFRFTLFDLVLNRHGQVARAWSPYASQSWRFLGLTILIALSLLLLFALSAGSLILHLIAAVRHLTPQQMNADPSLFITHIFPLYGILFLFVIVAGVINAVLQDFILPPMALEDAPLDVSFSHFFALLRTRFWHVALYLLLRYALEIGLGMIGGIVLFLVLLILGGGGAGIGFVLYRAFWHAGPGGAALFVAFCILAGLVVVAAYLLMIVALYGFIAVVKQSYAVHFYGAYYPPLGDRLGPPAAPPAMPGIPFASTAP